MTTRASLLILLVTLAAGPIGCEQQELKSRKLMRVDPDEVTDRRGWVILESGKRVAEIYHQGTVHTDRAEGTYTVSDVREDSDSYGMVGYITGFSGQITEVGAGLGADETRTTNEVVDVTSDRGLVQAARFLMKLNGPLDIVTVGEYKRMAK